MFVGVGDELVEMRQRIDDHVKPDQTDEADNKRLHVVDENVSIKNAEHRKLNG